MALPAVVYLVRGSCVQGAWNDSVVEWVEHKGFWTVTQAEFAASKLTKEYSVYTEDHPKMCNGEYDYRFDVVGVSIS